MRHRVRPCGRNHAAGGIHAGSGRSRGPDLHCRGDNGACGRTAGGDARRRGSANRAGRCAGTVRRKTRGIRRGAGTGSGTGGVRGVAGFDVRSDVIGETIGGLPVYEIGQLSEWQREHGVSIAIITVPVENAQAVADLAIASGMTALWNFTPYRIKAPADVVIANTSIYAHLAIIYNRMQMTNAGAEQDGMESTTSSKLDLQD